LHLMIIIIIIIIKRNCSSWSVRELNVTLLRSTLNLHCSADRTDIFVCARSTAVFEEHFSADCAYTSVFVHEAL